MELEKAKVRDKVIICPDDGKRLAEITPEGIVLWCRAGKHQVVLSYRDILKIKTE